MTKDYTLPTEEWDIPLKPTCSECESEDLYIEVSVPTRRGAAYLSGGIFIRCNDCGHTTTSVALNIRKEVNSALIL